MLDWIVIAGCAGGVGGMVFGIVVERMRRSIIDHRAELHAERVRATAMGREVVSHSRPPETYVNGSAPSHASLDG